ncbi:hypothetical protein NMG60_11012412 [Bertholletia excelsa]
MEQYYSEKLMWVKSNSLMNSHFEAPMSGIVRVGPTWPPSSYTCSFCKREFMSAQALGGHMNVHRRDRARVKQSPNPQIEAPPHHHRQVQTHHTQTQDQRKDFPQSSIPWSDVPDPGPVFKQNTADKDLMVPDHNNFGSTRLFMMKNLAFPQYIPSGSHAHDILSYKKRRTMQFLPKSCQPEVIGLKTGSLEDLDLELRLGDTPKVRSSNNSPKLV